MLVKVGIRKLGQREVFGDEGFGECRAHDIGFVGRTGYQGPLGWGI